MNSWLHNTARLVTGKPRCVVTMHPDDAARLGLSAGEEVTLRSTTSAITVPLRVSDEIKPGVLCMPYGWGHGREGSRLSVARKQGGASYNDLVDARGHDPVSGASVLNGIEVTVERATPDAARATP
ncbi:MAG: molybdopterin dinucleotide binding domain-containing protein [Minicystis sp.]